MMDARIRALERSAATGDPAARVVLIAARIRAGQVREDRVRLAAGLGDPASRAALGFPAADRDPWPRWLWRLFEGGGISRLLRPSGHEVLVRAAVAMTRLALLPGDPRTEAVVEAAEAWTVQPGELLRSVCQARGAALESLWFEMVSDGTIWTSGREDIEVAMECARVITTPARAHAIVDGIQHGARRCVRDREQLSWAEAGERVHAAVRDDVVAWALGTQPPEFVYPADVMFWVT